MKPVKRRVSQDTRESRKTFAVIMPEREPNAAASKFVASLIKSLQVICNGDVDFNESVELIGYINVRVDRKLKYDYIVDEQVCKGEDSAATFLSNSYHSNPRPCLSLTKNIPGGSEQDLSADSPVHSEFMFPQVMSQAECRDKDVGNLFSVKVQSPRSQGDHMVVKLEGGDDSNDCMVLPTTAGKLFSSACENQDQASGTDTTSAQVEGSESNGQTQKQPRENQGHDLSDGICDSIASFVNKGSIMTGVEQMPNIKETNETSFQGSTYRTDCIKNPKDDQPNNQLNAVFDFKRLVSKLVSLCDLPIIQDELVAHAPKADGNAQNLKYVKKKFFENFSKENMKKLKEAMKLKKGKQRKKRLRAILSDSGLSSEQLLLLTQVSAFFQKSAKISNSVDISEKVNFSKEHRRQMRSKTQERQQRLLEMAEILKKNQSNDPGVTVVSKIGDQKCTLHKSSVSVVSHNSLQLSMDTIDEVAETLTGKGSKPFPVMLKSNDKTKDHIKVENRKCGIKKKMKQMIGKMLSDVNEAGYHVIVTSTIGSETGAHSADLSVVPLKVDDFLPEVKESEVKPELTEEEYAKQLEREQILEKQKVCEEKMKEVENKLIRILSGAEEIFVPTRKRYGSGEERPSDAERMKEYRKRLKQNPDKYQMYKQKRVMNKKWRRLGQLAAKVKVNSNSTTVTVIPASVNDESHDPQSMSALVSLNQSVGNVNMHCPQVFEHPNNHQPSASVVNVHHTNQFVGQVSAMHPTHQGQPITYGNDMEFVELIAASHTVQNQHFG